MFGAEDKCIDCGEKPDPTLYLEYPTCRACYDANAELFKQFKQTRKTTYPEIDKIEDNLYLGNEDAAIDKDLLKSKGITHVLAVGTFLEMRFPEEFTYENLLVDDSPHQNIAQFFKKAFKFINSSKVVFVHCAAGVSRSATIVIAYTMFTKKMSFEEAHKYVKERRSIIFPNSGFRTQLQEFEKQLNDGTFKLEDDA